MLTLRLDPEVENRFSLQPEDLMRLALLAICAAFCVTTQAADLRAIYLGENPPREERQRIEHFFEPFHRLKEYRVMKTDLNRDGINEYAILLSENSPYVLLLDLQKTFITTLFGAPFPGEAQGEIRRSFSINLVPAIDEHSDAVLVHSPTTCGLLQWHNGAWRTEYVDCALTVNDLLERRRSCVKDNGRWQITMDYRQGRCVWPTMDTGKICTDKQDCKGLCVYSGYYPRDLNRDVTGKCSEKTELDRCVPTVNRNRYFNICSRRSE
jgi:hypothetical protein